MEVPKLQVGMEQINRIIAKNLIQAITGLIALPLIFSFLTIVKLHLLKVVKETVWVATFLRNYIINNCRFNINKVIQVLI